LIIAVIFWPWVADKVTGCGALQCDDTQVVAAACDGMVMNVDARSGTIHHVLISPRRLMV